MFTTSPRRVHQHPHQPTPIHTHPHLTMRMHTHTLVLQDLIWESIETTDPQRCRRVVLVYCLLGIILLLSAALVYIVSVAEHQFFKPPPSLTRCRHDIPAATYSSLLYPRDARYYAATNSPACPDGYAFVGLNSSTVGPPTYVQSVTNANGSLVLGDFGNNACLSPCLSLTGTTAAANRSTTCPVLGTDSGTFPVADVADCFCQAELGRHSLESDLISAVSKLKSQYGQLCGDFADRCVCVCVCVCVCICVSVCLCVCVSVCPCL